MEQAANIKELLENAGFPNAQFSRTSDGLYNDSYYIDSPQGKYLLRIAPADDVPKLFYEVDMMQSEPAIHRVVRQHTDLPVPDIVYSDFSREFLGCDYLIMEFLPGKPGRFDEKKLGEYTRQLHDIESNCYGYPERQAPTGDRWPELFQDYVERIFSDCLSCAVISQEEHDGFLSLYERYLPAVEETPTCLLHLDLWTQNILTRNGSITGILDFDRGLYGDPELEFAVLDTYGYATPRFFQGYGRERPSDVKAQIRQKLYIVYELIKYAFIRTARGGNLSLGRQFVYDCQRILESI